MGHVVILSFTDPDANEFEAVGFNVREDILQQYQRLANDLRETGWNTITALEGSRDPLTLVACQRAFNLYSEAAAKIDEAIEALGYRIGSTL